MDKDEKTEAKADPLHEHREHFARFMQAWDEDRKRYVEDLKFAAGEQWDEKDKKARADEGRPCLVVDKLGQYKRQVVNDSRQNRPGIKVRPVDSGADVETAEIFQGLTRHIEDRSNADTAYDTALGSAVDGGFGFFRILREYATESSFDQELCIKRIRNPLTVLFDPDCQEADGSDARRVYLYEDIPEDVYEATYPDAEKIDWSADDIKGSDWFAEKKVRVAECYWIEKEQKTLHLLADGTTATDEEIQEAQADGVEIPEIVQSREVPVNVLKWGKFNGKEYLEGPQTEPGKWIPVIPVWGNETDIEGKVIHTGMIHPAKDAQRLYNYSRTASAERLSKPGVYVAADGQINEYAEDWDGTNRNVAVKRYNPMDVAGTMVPPPRFDATDIPSALVQDMQISEHDIQGALGMYNASLGEKSNEKSGKAIVARQREGDMANFHFHDNLARAIRHAGRILVNLIPKVYDSARTVRVLGQDGTAEMVQINPDLPVASAKMSGKAIYNLNVGEYDVSVSVGPSYTTQRQEAADAMGQMFQGNPNLMPLIGDLFFRSQDWPMADDIADRLKLMLPPQILQAEEQKDGPDPKVQAMMQQVEQVIAQKDEVMQGAVQKIQALAQENAELKFAAEQADLKAQQTAVKAASDVLAVKYDLASANIKAEEQDAVIRVTQMAQADAEQKEPQLDVRQILQSISDMQSSAASEANRSISEMNASISTQLNEAASAIAQAATMIAQPKHKTGKAVRQPDGSYIMESIEESTNVGT